MEIVIQILISLFITILFIIFLLYSYKNIKFLFSEIKELKKEIKEKIK